ncbi:MAG: tryptophan--tRNA ligase [Opitutales bacterium]|jgi:tryptophanyl-tRNA synthetase
MSDEQKKVVLTCAQPSGNLHLGNYFGALKNWRSYLDQYECFFGIANMHAITLPYVPAELRKSVYDLVAVYAATGLDPEKCHIFLQSQVPGHAELAWILACICPLGQLERMTQYKQKSAKQGESVGAGLLYYPALMAADILIYNADAVPVGEDQRQHVELTRDLAIKFNNTYSDTFKVPDLCIPTTGARIKSLQDPDKKMSKSDANQAGCVYLLDEPNVIRKKIASAVTDSGCEIVAREDKPGISNLLGILSACTDRPVADLEREFEGGNYGQFKAAVADEVIRVLDPIRTRYKEIAPDKAYLDKVLAQGAEAATRRASRLMSKVYRKVGFNELTRA